MPMQHAESTADFDAILSALGSHLSALSSRNIALHTGTQRVCVCVCVCERVTAMECDEALNQIQLVAEHWRYVAGVLATDDCAVFVRGCDSEQNSARQVAPISLSRP